MEEKNIIRIEDQIQFAFENFSQYGVKEQRQLVEMVTKRFKIDQMSIGLKKPILFGLASLAHPIEEREIGHRLRMTVTTLLNDSLLAMDIKQSINEPQIEVLTNFCLLEKLSESPTDANWQNNVASMHPKLAETIIDSFLGYANKNLESNYRSHYTLNLLVSRLIQLSKIHDLKIGQLVLAFKNEPTHLATISKDLPEAGKYLNMI